MPLLLTPLRRLTSAFEMDLAQCTDDKLEGELAEKYLKRLSEAQSKRDAVFKSAAFIDIILLFAVSGKDLTIPVAEIKLTDVPAFLEILAGLSAFTAYMAMYTFISWLCYQQIHYIFTERKAKNKYTDPDLLSYSEILSEPTLKMLRPRMNFSGPDWADPGRAFSSVSLLYSLANGLFFLVIPVAHYALTYSAIKQIFASGGNDIGHIVFYVWIILSNILTVFMWFAPNMLFSFEAKQKQQV